MQENPGTFFTVVQIGLNAVAILGGIVGDAAFSPAFHSLLSQYMSAELSEQLSFIISFTLVTSLFILFADLTPKRIGMIAPEAVALRIINPMRNSQIWLKSLASDRHYACRNSRTAKRSMLMLLIFKSL